MPMHSSRTRSSSCRSRRCCSGWRFWNPSVAPRSSHRKARAHPRVSQPPPDDASRWLGRAAREFEHPFRLVRLESQSRRTGDGRSNLPLETRSITMAKIDLYQEVTNAIVAELEAGTVPWKQPWSRSPGRNVVANAVTKRAYSGINVLALWIAMAKHGYAVPRFLTFKQALDAGGNVRKGEHGHRVYFVKDLKFEDGENADGEERTRSVRMLKRFVVFNVAQCEGLPERLLTIPPPKARNPDGRDEWADAFVAATGARIIEGAGDVASYNPRTDTINVPAFGSFKSRDTYYAASFHELTQ